MSQTNGQSKFVTLTGMWRKEKADKSVFLAGGGYANYFVFPNTKKTKDTDPDYFLCVANSEPKEKKEEPRRNDF